jgi:hypothetical protein
MDDAAGGTVTVLQLRWPCLPLCAAPQDALEGGRASGASTAPAVAPPAGQQSACATCAGPIVGKRRGAKFCSDGCRVKAAGAAFRQRKKNGGHSDPGFERSQTGQNGHLLNRRRITDAAAILHPGEPERPFLSSIDEPSWLAAELRPPRLDCEG